MLVVFLVGPIRILGEVTVKGRELHFDGERIVVRGICYQPTPLGDNVEEDPPHADYFTAGYAALHERDLPHLRAMGVNVIRVYNWAPGVNHGGFLDACHNDGVQSIKVLVNRWIDPATNWSSPSAVKAISDQYVSMAQEIGAHASGFGLIVGNEVNEYNGNGNNTAFWQAMNTIMADVKAAEPGLLVTMAITDRLSQVEVNDALLPAMDAWSVQVYRGSSFGSFFSDYASASSKPLLITEFGYDNYDNRLEQAYPNNGAYPGNVVVGLIEESWEARDVCAGVFVFSYLDGLWKAEGSDTDYDPGGWVNPGFADGFSNEEWWGIFRPIAVQGEIDSVEPRSLYYDLKGLWGPPEELLVKFSQDDSHWCFSFSELPLRLGTVARLEQWDESLEKWTTRVRFSGATFSPDDRNLTFEILKEAGLFRAASNP